MTNTKETQIENICKKHNIHAVVVNHYRYVGKKISHNDKIVSPTWDGNGLEVNSQDGNTHWLCMHPYPMILRHCKELIKDSPIALSLMPSGGYTVVTFYDCENNIIAHGESNCSLTDVFKRKFGFSIAFKRALKNADITI